MKLLVGQLDILEIGRTDLNSLLQPLAAEAAGSFPHLEQKEKATKMQEKNHQCSPFTKELVFFLCVASFLPGKLNLSQTWIPQF